MGRSDRREYWSRVLSDYSRSGESVAGFCRQHEIAEASFYHWRKRLTEDASELFVPLAVVGSQRVQLELPCGATMQVPIEREALRVVIDVLFERSQAKK